MPGPRHLALLGALTALAVPASASALTVSPLSGTPDASPISQISVLGAAPSSITAVSVVGSRSGAHSGKLEPYSSNDGASFVLDKKFTQGETVKASVNVGGHKTSWSFTVGRVGAVSPPPVPKGKPTFNLSVLDSFVSEPRLLAPKVSVIKTSPNVASGDLLLTPAPEPPTPPNKPPNPKLAPKVIGPGGPMIVDGSGNLVWFHLVQQVPGTAPILSTDLKALTFQGKPALGWWQGRINPLGFGVDGEEMIVDDTYTPVAAIKAGNGYSVDAHDFILGSNGDAFVTVYAPVVANLTSLHGPKHAVVLDAIIQQIDIKTGLVKFEWHSYGHVSMADSYNTPVAVGFDPWHLNSMQLLGGNRMLISDRNTWAAYEIDLSSGRVLWTLGGKRSSFKMGKGTQFAFQHDIQLQPDGSLTLYDDAAGPPVVEKQSRGLALKVDMRHRRASVLRGYIRTGPGAPTLVGSQGNMQTLANGNKFVGFGAAPYFSEFSADGQLLFDAQLPAGDDSYRVYRVPWVGMPTAPPALAATGSAGNFTLYASWNGATEVAAWQVLAGSSPTGLSPVGGPTPRSGFETAIPFAGNAAYVAVQALSSAGQVLGTSAAIAP